MRALELVQPFYILNIEIFLGFPLRRKIKKSQNSNEVKNGCTNSKVRIVIIRNHRRMYESILPRS